MVPVNTAKAVESVFSTLPKLHAGADQTKDFRIWIDAICINQSDNKERAKQVSCMTTIYSRAAAVMICLGDHASPETSKAAISSLHDAYELCMHAYDGQDMKLPDVPHASRDEFNPSSSVDSEFTSLYVMETDTSSREDIKFIESVGVIYNSSWFQRVWTIQESGLAKRAWCILGGSTIPLYEITIVATALTRRLFNRMPKSLTKVSRGMKLVEERQNIKSLSQKGQFFPIIKAALAYSASDPRDMVYGVLGLNKEECRPVPTVIDYSCSLHDLYARVTVQSIILSQSLEPLQIAATLSEDGQNSDFPSWTMRLDRGKMATVYPLRPQFETFSDSGHWFDRLHELPLDTEWKKLRLKGAVFDEVAVVSALDSDPSFAHMPFINQISAIRSSIIASRLSTTVDSTNATSSTQQRGPDLTEPLPRFILRRSVANVVAAGLYAKNEDHLQTNIKGLEDGQRRHIELNGTRDGTDRHFRKAMERAFRRTKPIQRSFLITKRGRFGLGPLTTLLGDQVCVFNGGAVPFVLRQQGDSWRLMGDAYVKDLEQEKQWRDLATFPPTHQSFQDLGREATEHNGHGGEKFSKIPVIDHDDQPGVPIIQMQDFDIQ
ncbi:hypothetical protein E8E14_009078 [Neopestalotiopsis sp. 37M]|nr:hypothetical protein E8E14_009078 [Neopestalotiopsis sp. 37M]